jgi:cytoskeletal protein CcmA (bactofilin family)
MATITNVPTRSERGIALIVVLLLMAVLSGLATGFAMNGQVETGMANNEVYYAGARAAAEAGINRAASAIRLEDTVNLLKGQDDTVDAVNAAAAVNADNGNVGFLLTGASPYALDPQGRYRYTVQVLDDDDPALYNGTLLSPAQLTAMGNEGTLGVPDPFVDHNTRLILRATGFGPSNTTVTVARVLLTTIIPVPGSTVNPAILVDGDLEIDGSLNLNGVEGSVHANGDLTISGVAADVSKNATASGTFTAPANFDAGGSQGGDYGSINIPPVVAADFASIADFILADDGNAYLSDGTTLCGVLCNDWTWTAAASGPGTWEMNSNSANDEGTFFVEGFATISGSPGTNGNPLNLTIIATASISVTGSPNLAPDTLNNPQTVQFVTDGDLKIGGSGESGTSNAVVEGQIFVKEQIQMSGTPNFEGRIIVQNEPSVFNEITTNSISGTPTITYQGLLPGYVIPPTVDYTYNITGWMES